MLSYGFHRTFIGGLIVVSMGAAVPANSQEAMMIVTHEVRDFDRWKEIFDSALPTRRAVGEMSAYILHNPINRNVVIVAFEWDTMENARAFASDPMLANGMRAAGVFSEPSFTFVAIDRLN